VLKVSSPRFCDPFAAQVAATPIFEGNVNVAFIWVASTWWHQLNGANPVTATTGSAMEYSRYTDKVLHCHCTHCSERGRRHFDNGAVTHEGMNFWLRLLGPASDVCRRRLIRSRAAHHLHRHPTGHFRHITQSCLAASSFARLIACSVACIIEVEVAYAAPGIQRLLSYLFKRSYPSKRPYPANARRTVVPLC
jgi:hypothetical protein